MFGSIHTATTASAPTSAPAINQDLLDRQTEAETFLHALYGDEAPGFIVLWVNPHKDSYWAPAKDMRRVARGAIRLSDNANTYFGIGLHPEALGPKQRGEASGVTAIPGFWMDADVLGPAHKAPDLPPSIDEVLAIINSLPQLPSAIVDSGHGLQAWWLFKELWLLESDEERKQAQQLIRRFQRWLQRKAREKGYRLDNTSDLARVLRVPGTINRKPNLPPVPVKRLHLDESIRYNPDDFDWLPEIEPESYIHSSQGNFPPVEVDPILAGCAWMRHCQENAETLTEPHWYASLSVLGRCQDGAQLAHAFSKPYPGYTPEETQAKLEHALRASGPRTCANIHHELEFDGCLGCPNWRQVTSPIVLGMPPTARQIEEKKRRLMIEEQNGSQENKPKTQLHFRDKSERWGVTTMSDAILLTDQMTGNEKTTYQLLRYHARLDDHCFPSQELLRSQIPCSLREVSRILAHLEQLGLINIERRGLNKPNIYWIEPLTQEIIERLHPD